MADHGGAYTSKPRPAVIAQADAFSVGDSVVVCLISSVRIDAPLFRVLVNPADHLPLARVSWIEVDKVPAVRQARPGALVGRLGPADLLRLNGALAVFLGLA